jgi:hypothetical protein
MNRWDELAIDYLIAAAKDERLSKAERATAERRLFRYVVNMRNPKATKAQIDARVIAEAGKANAIEGEVV